MCINGLQRKKQLVALLIGLLLSSAFCATAVFAQDKPAPLSNSTAQRQQLQKLQKRINGLQQDMRQDKGRFNQLSKELQKEEREISKVARRLRVLTGQLKRQHKKLKKLRTESAQQRHSLSGERIALIQQIRAAYAMGQREKLKVLLSQQDPALLSRMLSYYDYMNRARINRMTTLTDKLIKLQETEKSIVAEELRIQGLRDKTDKQRETMQVSQNKRRKIIAQLSNQMQDKGERLSRLQADEKQLQALLQGIEQVMASIKLQPQKLEAFRKRRGKMNWPTRGSISVNFGTEKIGGLLWDGVMISAPEGREIMAVHHGRVAYADWLRGFGLLIIIDHGDGYMSLYGHNQSLFKEAGDWVDVGEVVAAVGSSGGRQDSGVYFAIRKNGKAVNPKKWCKRVKGRRIG